MNEYKILSRDIKSIINKYLDYSNHNLQRIYDKNKNFKVKFKTEMTIKDMIVKSCQLGYVGFYVSLSSNIYDLIRQMYKPNDYDYLNLDNNICFCFKKTKGLLCHIDRLDVIEYYWLK